MHDNKFESFIKSKRIELGLTLRQAADLVGVSHSYISIMEKGVDPRTGFKIKLNPKIIKQISIGYNVDFHYLMSLLGYIDDPNDIEVVHETSSDIEYAFNDLFEILDRKDALFLNGKVLDDSDWNNIKSFISIHIDGLKSRYASTKTSSHNDAYMSFSVNVVGADLNKPICLSSDKLSDKDVSIPSNVL
ncbi:MAG: helix-turn-helix domain-containing protein [Clostridium sp.]